MRAKRRIAVVAAAVTLAVTGAAPPAAAATFMNATDGQILDTGYNFPNVDTVHWAKAARAATTFCVQRRASYPSGGFTGQQAPNQRGVVCILSSDAKFYDMTDGQLYDTGQSFPHVDRVHWAKAARAATAFCKDRGIGSEGGFFTGHQGVRVRGVYCMNEGETKSYQVTDGQIMDTGSRFTNIDTVPWAKAARAANAICTHPDRASEGFAGGLFTGNQSGARKELLCLRR